MLNLKFLTGVFIGAAAGAAIVYFLGTDEGKKLRKKLQDEASNLEKELRKDFEKISAEEQN